MSLDSIRTSTLNYFTSRFAQQMNAELGAVPQVIMPNSEEPEEYPFVKFMFMESESHNAALNRKLERHIGFVQVDVFTKENTGSQESNLICDSISTILSNQKLNNAPGEMLNYQVGTSQEVGSKSGKYHQMVRVPYYRDVTA